jgi:hypothetical protein
MQDDKIRELLSGTKMKAGENLKYRIMHRIETEKALTRQKKKAVNSNPFIGSTVAVFGVMYALIALVVLGTYFIGGQGALKSFQFFAPVVLIASACSIFWMISVYDDSRKNRQKTKR